MYAEYTKYPLITKQRMFYETMEEVLPTLRIYIVDESGTQKLLPLDSFAAEAQGTTSQGNEAARSADAQPADNGEEETEGAQ